MSKGKPKAGNHANDVQDLLASTITLFKVNLLKHDPYANQLLETTWPFSDEEEWELVQWLIKNVMQTTTKEFLKMEVVYHISELRKASSNRPTGSGLQSIPSELHK